MKWSSDFMRYGGHFECQKVFYALVHINWCQLYVVNDLEVCLFFNYCSHTCINCVCKCVMS